MALFLSEAIIQNLANATRDMVRDMKLRYPVAARKAIETGCRWLLPEDVEKAQKKVLSHLGQRGAARKKSLQKKTKVLELKAKQPSAQEKAAPADAPVQLKLL